MHQLVCLLHPISAAPSFRLPQHTVYMHGMSLDLMHEIISYVIGGSDPTVLPLSVLVNKVGWAKEPALDKGDVSGVSENILSK